MFTSEQEGAARAASHQFRQRFLIKAFICVARCRRSTHGITRSVAFFPQDARRRFDHGNSNLVTASSSERTLAETSSGEHATSRCTTAGLGVGPVPRLCLATRIIQYEIPPDGLPCWPSNVGVEIGQLLALTVILIGMSYWHRTSGLSRHAYTDKVAMMSAGSILVGMQLIGFFVSWTPEEYRLLTTLKRPCAPSCPPPICCCAPPSWPPSPPS